MLVHVLMCRFVEDKINFGLNTDDSAIIGTTLNHEFEIAATKYGLTQEQLIESVFNSLRSSFLPVEEKRVVMDRLEKKMDDYKRMTHS